MKNTKAIKDWAAYLRLYRKRYTLTQRELGKLLGVSRRSIENWEGGINQPPAFLKLALAYLTIK